MIPMLKVDEIVSATSGDLIKDSEDTRCRGVSIDSRTINEGEVFIAIEGENFNGHDFIHESLQKGAKGIIYSDDLNFDTETFESNFFVKVENTVEALGKLANFYREKFSPDVVGITGSVGKTTTKNFIYEILSNQYKVCKSLGTQNNNIGVSLNIIKYAPYCDILVLELGTSVPGEISYLAEISSPNVGVILNVGPSHLEYFKSVQEVKEEKLSLLNHISSGGYGIINRDFFDNLEMERKNIVTIGINEEADFQAYGIKIENNKMKFKVKGQKFTVKIINKDYIYNLLASIAVASIFEVKKDVINQAFQELEVTDSRFQIKKLSHCMIFDDTYNSNPLSLRSSLEGFMKYSKEGRKLLVLGDMLELGENSKEYHVEIGELIANMEVDKLCLVGEMSQYIKEGSLNKGMDEKNIVYFGKVEEACRKIPPQVKKGDMILIKGSRSMKMERIVQSIQQKKD